MLQGFQYHLSVIEQFPRLVGGILVVRDVTNPPASDELIARFETEQKTVCERIGDRSLSELEPIAAWRTAFRGFGVEPTQYRNAAEALLRRLTKKGDIPSVNSLVDIGNLISIRYALPIAIFDVRDVKGFVTVRFADGTESFTPLGSTEVEHPEPGEVIFVDESSIVLARRWCWRQSAQSAAREDTTHVLITIEGQHANCRYMVQQAQGDLISLVMQHVGGNLISGILDIWRPQMPKDQG